MDWLTLELSDSNELIWSQRYVQDKGILRHYKMDLASGLF